jgi:hypothetical protein
LHDRQLALGALGAVEPGVALAAAEQLPELDDVLGPDGIRVRKDQQDRDPDGLDPLGPVVVGLVHLAGLAHHRLPVDVGVELRERRGRESPADGGGIARHLREGLPALGIVAVSAEGHGDRHQLLDQLRMPDRDLQCDAGAERIAHEAPLADAEVPEHGRDVVANASVDHGPALSVLEPWPRR